MRNSALHDIELCRTISTEFKYRSTCLISWFNFRSRSTYFVWILFQFCQSDRIRFIIIQRLFAHNNIDHYRSDLRILYARKNSVKEISLGPGSGWANVESGRAGPRNTRATLGRAGPLFCCPFRALLLTYFSRIYVFFFVYCSKLIFHLFFNKSKNIRDDEGLDTSFT
jgi:hypothetical protein